MNPGKIIRRPGTRWFLLAVTVYTVATVVLMYPLPFRIRSAIAGLDTPSADFHQYTWWLWWMKYAVVTPGAGLARITLINHPVGVYHPFLLTTIGVGLTALPFSLLFTPAATYNIQVLLSFILAGLSMYWLGSELTGDRRAGLVAGFIYAFFPNKTGHVLAGHLPQLTVYWFPLYTLFLWRAVRKPSWRNTLLVALTLVPACLVHVMHIAYLILPITVTVLFVAWMEMKRAFFVRRRILSLLAAFGLAALVVAPFLLPTVFLAAQDASYLSKTGIVKSSTDLLAFFTPSPYHPVMGQAGLLPRFAERVFDTPEALREGLAYPGLVVVGLAIYALIRRRRETWVWAVLALAAATLSMGPLLKIGNQLAVYQVDWYKSFTVLPYALLQRLPILGVGRTPGRLNETTMFALAVLAAYGVAELGRALAHRVRLLRLLLVLLVLAIGFEYVVVWPFPVAPAEIPASMETIADDPGAGAVLHLPAARGVGNLALYYQTAIGRPIVGGYIHRNPPEMIPWTVTLKRLGIPDAAGGDAVPRPSPSGRVAWLRHFDIDYVVVHSAEVRGGAESRRFIETLLGPPTAEDSTLAVFRVPNAVPALESPRLYTFGGGWHPAEKDGDTWRRWLYDDGQLHVYSVGDEVGSLQFTVDSPLDFPVLEIYLGEHLLDSIVVGDRATYVTHPFTLTGGMHTLRFHARGGCVAVVDDARCGEETLYSPPSDSDPLPCDPDTIRDTCRTFVIDRVSFVSEAEAQAGEGIDINLGDEMRLRGWRIDDSLLRPGGALTVTLAWEPQVEVSDRYVVFVHLLAADGTLVAQHDAAPIGALLPASAWPRGTTLTYPVALALPAELPSGEYRVLVGVYLWPSIERLPVPADVPGAEVRAVELGTVQVAP